MALAPVAVPPYPDVPHAPGVPPVLRQIGAIENTAVMLVSDAVAIVRMFEGPQWGIFSADGQPVIIGDSVVAVDYRREYRVSDYPVEAGGFASYDKVQAPFDVRITFAVSGKQSLLSSLLSGGALGALITGTDAASDGRRAFLSAMEQAAASLYLFTAVTPEATYQSCNIVHYDYRREARNGATLIKVDVWLVQIRVVKTARSTQTGSNTSAAQPTADAKSDSAAPQQNNGTVQAQPPTPEQSGPPPASNEQISVNKQTGEQFDSSGNKLGSTESDFRNRPGYEPPLPQAHSGFTGAARPGAGY